MAEGDKCMQVFEDRVRAVAEKVAGEPAEALSAEGAKRIAADVEEYATTLTLANAMQADKAAADGEQVYLDADKERLDEVLNVGRHL